MRAVFAPPDFKRLQAAGCVIACLLLAVCEAPGTTPPRWLKAGADDAVTERELNDCKAQANAELANEQETIDTTIGRNWLLQGAPVVPFERQLRLEEAAEHAARVFDICMRAKGFTKEG